MTPQASIPSLAFAETVAVVGRTGSGKTFAAKGQIEQLLARGERVCIIDPTSVWHGLRSSADGTRPGFPVVVFGGVHADVALAEASAEPLAHLIAGRNLPCVVDISEMTRGEQNRFVTHFLDTLYRTNKQPLTMVFDEADLYCPQRPMPDQTVLLNRMEQIVRRGRVRGFRPWLITQRPAELHKSVLSQAGTLIAMRLTSPQDRDAIGAWIEGQADRAAGKKLLADLPKLATGEGFVWCPTADFLQRITFPTISTFDTGRTPQHGAAVPAPVRLADVDLTGVLEALRPVEPAPARGARSGAKPGQTSDTQRSVPDEASVQRAFQRGFDEGYRAGLASAQEQVSAADGALARVIDTARAAREHLAKGVMAAPSAAAPRPAMAPIAPMAPIAAIAAPRPIVASAPRPAPARPVGVCGASVAMPKAERLILTTLAQYPAGRTKNQAALLAGYAVNGGGFNNALSALRSKGWMNGSGAALAITATGAAALGRFDPLPTGPALLDHWLAQLGKAERETLRVLAQAYPSALSKEDTAARAGYEPKGGGFGNALSRLRTLNLITGRGELRASAEFFE